MKKRSLNKIKQIVSIGMSCIMAGSTCNLPMMLHAEEVQTENMQPTYMVTSFDERLRIKRCQSVQKKAKSTFLIH